MSETAGTYHLRWAVIMHDLIPVTVIEHQGPFPPSMEAVYLTYQGKSIQEAAAKVSRGEEVTLDEAATVTPERAEAAQAVKPLTVARTYDAFRAGNAPKEEMGVGANGEMITGYSGEAYSADYMVPSDETGRGLRWVYVLSDGRRVFCRRSSG